MDSLYTFWDNTTHYKTESVHFSGLMSSVTKYRTLSQDRLNQAFPLCQDALNAGVSDVAGLS